MKPDELPRLSFELRSPVEFYLLIFFIYSESKLNKVT